VTILFADLAGSTALGERLDPEELRVLQGELFDLVNGEVERHGGVTEKFIGDAILAVFGAPQAHEDDPERAVRTALAIRERFPSFAERVRAQHGGEVGLRIGIDTGEVVAGRDAVARGELMVTGDTVNVAARLQQLAEPGEVLVGDRTRTSTQRAIAYRDHGELEAKGKALPMRAWNALDALRAPGNARADSSARLIGRDDELALLRLAVARVVRERMPQLVTLFGQAGVGKSRLVSEFVDGLEAGRVVVGRCVPYGDGITYLPLAEIGNALAGIHEDEPARTALEKLREAVASTSVPENRRAPVVDAVAWTMGLALPERTAGIGAGTDLRKAMHGAWTTYIAALGRSELLVMVVEDVHWASAPLLDLLEELVGALEDTAVLIVCPSRPELLDTRPSWGTGQLNASSLTLAPLDAEDAERLLGELLGSHALPAHVADRILAPAEGNPFFVEEMLAMLVEQGAIQERGGRWVEADRLASTSLPDSVHGVIAARLDLLEAREREALRRCSVMGRVFWPSAVDVDDDVVAALGRRAIVSEQPQSAFSGRREFMFKHALTHEVAYATLPRYERGSLHGLVARWIGEVTPDRQGETTELIAFHYDQALRWGNADEDLRRHAFEATLGAGDSALSRGAYASGERLLDRALELAETADERARALMLAARADIGESQYERALVRLAEATEVAGAIGDVRLRGDALGLRARAAWLRGQWRDALELAEEAVATLERLPDSPELARALSRLSQVEMLRALSTAGATARRAIEVAVRTGERAAEANARINLMTVDGASGVLVSAEDVSDMVELAKGAGAHDEAARAVVNYLWSAAVLGTLEDSERVVGSHGASVERGLNAEGFDNYLDLSLAALIHVPAGRWGEADEIAAREQPDVPTNRLVWLWLVAGQAFRRGDLELADRYLSELRDSALPTEEPQRILPMASVAMPRAALAGDDDDVRELADVVLELARTQDTVVSANIAIPRAIAAVGDRARLEAVAETLGSLPQGVPGVVADLSHGLLSGLDGRHEEAARALATAAEHLEALGRGYEVACVTLDLGASLAAAGDSHAAEDARARAAAFLDPLGCVNPY
jgi:class 3 adenylate cyclase/tetratricopeptide (TPR) repeat protein